MEDFMGPLLKKEVLYLSLCLITLFSLIGCASNERSLAKESEIKRAPPADDFVSNAYKITNRRYVGDRN